MRIPILQEIKIPERHPHALEALFKTQHLGEIPCYWVSDIPFEEELNAFLNLFENLFRQFHVDSHFPYPFYVVTTVIDQHPFFPVISSVTQLPVHFQQKNKRPKVKEQAVAQKVEILSHMLRAMDLTERREGLRLLGKKTRALYRHAAEHAVLTEMLQKISDNSREEKR